MVYEVAHDRQIISRLKKKNNNYHFLKIGAEKERCEAYRGLRGKRECTHIPRGNGTQDSRLDDGGTPGDALFVKASDPIALPNYRNVKVTLSKKREQVKTTGLGRRTSSNVCPKAAGNGKHWSSEAKFRCCGKPRGVISREWLCG